jgi:hypothetical protein
VYIYLIYVAPAIVLLTTVDLIILDPAFSLNGATEDVVKTRAAATQLIDPWLLQDNERCYS